jgi:hypothetical protein
LEEDDRRDAQRETLNDRPGNERDRAAKARHTCGQHEQAGKDRHQSGTAEAVLSDHRGEHHGHCPCGPGDLDVRAAEHRSHQPRDDRGDQSRRGADARADTEGQRERQRDHTDGDAGQDVTAPGPGQVGVVAAVRQQACELAGRSSDHRGLLNGGSVLSASS